MSLCGVEHIDLRHLNWRGGFLLILVVLLGRLLLDIGLKGTPVKHVSNFREDPVPSFMLMDLQGMSLVLYIYTLENEQIKVEKVELLTNGINDSCRIEKGSHNID
jgi:hypothetical protein